MMLATFSSLNSPVSRKIARALWAKCSAQNSKPNIMMQPIFLLDEKRWIAASLEHFAVWERTEREIFQHMDVRITPTGLAKAMAYYRVARNFKVERRDILMRALNKSTLTGSLPIERFDSFVSNVRRLTKQYAQQTAVEHRRVRPISGISKMLWYRFPFDGFIYDWQVFSSICKNGLTVRFDSRVEAFGGKPTDDHEWNFLIAAAAYRHFMLPLHQGVADVLRSRGLEPERAARLLDMLFWREGRNKGLPPRKPPPLIEKTAIEIGQEAFLLCRPHLKCALWVNE
jgi:hypothetical protein